MKKILNRWKLILPSLLVLLLTSCKSVIDKTGQVLPEFVIKLTTPWSLNMGFFDAILIWPMAQLINYISQYTGVVVSIIILTVLVSLLTFKATLKSQVMTQKMNMIQPKMTAIQEKYKGLTDQQSQLRQSQEIQSLYKKHDIKMGQMLLPTLIQFPILIAMWQGIQRSEAVIEGTLLGQPLYLSPLQGMQQGKALYFVLAILVVLAQVLSMKLPTWLAKKHAKVYPGQKPVQQQNKGMMTFMMIFIAYIGITVTSGMSLYLIISATIRVIQQFYTQKHINKGEQVI